MEKKKIKFNIVDIIVVLVIIAAVVLVGSKFVSKDATVSSSAQYKISFRCDEVPSFAAEAINEGDYVTDDDKNSALGVVEEVTIGPSKTYASTADGKWNLAPKDGFNCVEVTAVVDAQEFQHGIIVNAAKYGIGHSLTIRVGKAKIYGRVSGLEKIN